MQPTDPIQLALDTWTHCQSLLPSAVARGLTTAPGDPQPFKKHGGGTNIVRLRILPRKKVPALFWSNAWCFYELGVGSYDNSALVLGGVCFLQFSDQKVCGGGKYESAVRQILLSAHKKRAEDFQLAETSGGGARMPFLGRRYRANPAQKFFPVEHAAKDLAWLISATLPEFQKLPSATS
jgi:hypothetical protein